MLIGVISDTHDNLPMIERAATLFARRGADVILHAGDFVAPFALKALMKPAIRLIGVFGNNDGEREGLSKLCSSVGEPPHRCELGGRTVVLAHDMAVLRQKDREGADLVVHGHTHQVRISQATPMTVNPGEAGGWLSGRCTVALVDLESLEAEIVDLGTQETIEL